MKVEKIRYPRMKRRESVPLSSHTYPLITNRGAELESELESELEVKLKVELKVELEFFSRPRGSPLSHTKVRKLQAGNFVPLKIFSNLT